MALPSLLDVIVIIVLILPGFVAFSVARFVAVFERKLEEFETVVWSLLLSLGIYWIFAVSTGIKEFDTLRDRILDPVVLAILLDSTLLVGMSIGTAWHIVVNKAKRPRLGNPWDVFFDDVVDLGGRDLVVVTSDGLEFKGWVGPSGKQDNRREVVIEKPVLVIRNKVDGKKTAEFPFGERILITEADIRRVAMLEKRKTKKSPEATQDGTPAA